MCSDAASERRQPLSRSAGTVNELCNQEFMNACKADMKSVTTVMGSFEGETFTKFVV